MKIFTTQILLLIFATTGFTQIESQLNNQQDYYASYFGGSGNEWGECIAVDNADFVYLAGHSNSTNLPVKSAYQSRNNGSSDAFIAKFSPDMKEVIFCTYLGDTGFDAITRIAVDENSNIYATGYTSSANFPVTDNALDNSHNGDYDLFLIKMNAQGELLYATFLGGSSKEQPRAMVLDDAGNMYITGFTNSTNFPVKSAYSNSYNGGAGNQYGFGGDAFVVKFDMKNDSLCFSTYLGGSGNEWAYGIDIDSEKNVYVVGETPSTNFPTKNGFDLEYNGNTDGFITKLNAQGNKIIYSTFFGGNQTDCLSAIQVNDNNEVYFIGGSASSNLACSENAFFTQRIGGEDFVIGKINSTGDSLNYLSYFGGTGRDYGSDGCAGLILVEGDTLILVSNSLSTNYPFTENALQKIYGGGTNSGDLVISKLNIFTKEITYSSYFGGSDDEGAHLGIVTKDNSELYIASFSKSNNFPTSEDAIFPTHLGALADATISKINLTSASTTRLKNRKDLPIPTKYGLNQNYPNPFNPTTTISYTLVNPSSVNLRIYNVQGQKITDLLDGFLPPGEHSIVWNARDESDCPVSSGIYVYCLETENLRLQRKMLLIR